MTLTSPLSGGIIYLQSLRFFFKYYNKIIFCQYFDLLKLLFVLKNRTYGKFKQLGMFPKISCSPLSPNSHLLNCREFQSIFINFFIICFTTFNISCITVYIVESTCKCTHQAFPIFTIINSMGSLFRNKTDKGSPLLTWQIIENALQTLITNTVFWSLTGSESCCYMDM